MVFCVRGLGGRVGELCEPDEQGGVPAPREDQRAAGPALRGPAPGAGRPQARLAPRPQPTASVTSCLISYFSF
jgi:hypothetical protein